MSLESIQTPEPWNLGLVRELEELNAIANDGRGVSVIRSVIHYLRNNKPKDARLVASHDHDKIRNYPELHALLKEKLFGGEELHRWHPTE